MLAENKRWKLSVRAIEGERLVITLSVEGTFYNCMCVCMRSVTGWCNMYVNSLTGDKTKQTRQRKKDDPEL